MRFPRCVVAIAALVAAGVLPAGAQAAIPGGVKPLTGTGACFLVSPGAGSPCAAITNMNYSRAVATSPDGKHVYALGHADPDTVRIFSRDAATGLLTPVGCVSGMVAAGCTGATPMDQPFDIAFSADGLTAYVAAAASKSVLVFDRDSTTGGLTQRACIVDDGGTVGSCASGRNLGSPYVLSLTSDGEHLYVASGTDGIAVLEPTEAGGLSQPSGSTGCVDNDGPTGVVCAPARLLPDARWVDVAPDGLHVYATSETGKSLLAFTRTPATGFLDQPNTASGCAVDIVIPPGSREGCAPVRGLAAPHVVIVHPSGDWLYVSDQGSWAVTTYAIDPVGGITQRATGNVCGGGSPICTQVSHFRQPLQLAIPPDGQHLYVVSLDSGSLTAYAIAADGALTRLAEPGSCWSWDGEDAADCPLGPVLDGPEGVVASPDGRHVYVVSQNAFGSFSGIAGYDRDLEAPVCDNGSAAVPHNTTVTVDLVCRDDGGEAITLALVSAPANGVIALDPAQPKATYGPPPGFSGQVTFTFRATAFGVQSNVATFTLDVAAPPPPPLAPPAPTCTPKPEIPGNGIDEDCNGSDARILPTLPVRIDAGVRPLWTTFRRYTLLTRLRIVNVISGAKVEVRCSGRGCPFKRRSFAVKRGTADASKPFRRRKLRPGVKIEVRITKPGAIGKIVTYTVRRRTVPRGVVRCLPPGATKPVRC